MDVLGKILHLLLEQKKEQKQLCEFIGIKPSVFSDWKGGRNKSYMKYLPQIAEYLNVSVDYLIGKASIRKDPPGMFPVGDTVPLRIVASVRAGYDGYAIEELSDDMECVPVFMLCGYSPDECRLFIVTGDSMWPKILAGDKIIVHIQPSVDSESTAIVIYNNEEGTVKKVKYVTGENWLEMIPANPEYPTRRIEGEKLSECHIYGKVIGLLRQI